MNTGQGFNNDPQKITAVELNLTGEYDSPTSVRLRYQDKEAVCYIVPLSRNLSKIQLPELIDTIGNFFQSNFYAPGLSPADHSKNQKYDFLFHPNGRGLEIDMNFYSRSVFAVESRMTNITEGKLIPRSKRSENLTGDINLKITYRNGVIVQVLKGEDEISRWFLKNTR